MAISSATQSGTPTTAFRIDRRHLLAAVQHAQAVVPARSCKPILTGAWLLV